MLKQLAPILVLGSILQTVWIATWLLGPFRKNGAAFVVLMLVAFALWIASFLGLALDHPVSVWTVLGFALLFRLTLLPAPPYHSEDVYRYLWDAKVQSSGFDPYLYQPSDPELVSLRDRDLYPPMNSKKYFSVYPPLSQLLFRTAYAITGSRVIGPKLMFSLFDFWSVLLIWRILVRFRQNPRRLLLVAWNPLFIFEFSHSGHADSAMVFFVLLALYLLARRKKGHATLSTLSLAASVLVKLHSLILGPFFARLAGWRAAALGIVTALTFSILLYSPESLVRSARSTLVYLRLFEFNAGLHSMLVYVGKVWGRDWNQQTGVYLAALLLIAVIVIWWRFPIRGEQDLCHAVFWVMTADVCLATTVHPWYLSWAAAMLPFVPYAFMTYWCGAVFLSYLAYSHSPVFEDPSLLLIEYVPMYLLMAWEIRSRGPLLDKWRSVLRRERVVP